MKANAARIFVETPEERDELVDAGTDLLQGYLFAKPGDPFPEPLL